MFEFFKGNKGEKQKTPERTKEELLEDLKKSFEKYGVQGLVKLELKNGELKIEQKLGSGVRGLGYDKNEESLWMCLDQKDPNTIKDNKKWNANTVLSLDSEMPGIKMEKLSENKVKIIMSADHPVASLAKLMGKENRITLPGGYNKWQRKIENTFQYNEDNQGLEMELDWDGSETECKVAILESSSNWESGKWEDHATQNLKTKVS